MDTLTTIAFNDLWLGIAFGLVAVGLFLLMVLALTLGCRTEYRIRHVHTQEEIDLAAERIFVSRAE